MIEKEFEKITNSIQEKLGKEKVGIIADDLGKLITDNANMNKEMKSKDDEISKLKDDKEKLIMTNSSLLQQVAMGDEPTESNKKEEIKPFDYRTAFDEKGNFKK